MAAPLLLLPPASPSLAATATSSLSASATVTNQCTVSASALGFGTYDPVGANAVASLPAVASILVTCTKGASTTIDLDEGLNPLGSVPLSPQRRMASGASRLSYFLYQNPGHSVPWGAGPGGDVAYTGTGLPGTVTVYGEIPAAQNLPAGNYSDTVRVVINF